MRLSRSLAALFLCSNLFFIANSRGAETADLETIDLETIDLETMDLETLIANHLQAMGGIEAYAALDNLKLRLKIWEPEFEIEGIKTFGAGASK